ncbi:BLUF domain-containing protein [Flavobacteriaceae bacterium 14752]|uniref:BLUF domain-containing protein n=1 Tax=Mesohalobacter salilacus TaxID=2491711 RepID=UPI000F62F37D|nr:BLUF domain-containing protein [Flavobacteriaceae bacterium 14752]
MSNQAQVLTNEGIEQLLFQIREKNKRLAITGILLLIQGKFVQYIEGEATEIDKVYEKIKLDSRHNDLVLLDSGELNTRQFKDWSMAYKKIGDDQIKEILGHAELNLDDLFLYPSQQKTHPVLKVLYNFTNSLST